MWVRLPPRAFGDAWLLDLVCVSRRREERLGRAAARTAAGSARAPRPAAFRTRLGTRPARLDPRRRRHRRRARLARADLRPAAGGGRARRVDARRASTARAARAAAVRA